MTAAGHIGAVINSSLNFGPDTVMNRLGYEEGCEIIPHLRPYGQRIKANGT